MAIGSSRWWCVESASLGSGLRMTELVVFLWAAVVGIFGMLFRTIWTLKSSINMGLLLVMEINMGLLLVRTYEEHCGPLSRYGRRYARVIVNMCNAGVMVEQMAMASATACHA
ncbi:hypothetical protein Vadar_013502 [Vaccinium darrowii]|uniref:Uncharacterized protein n=1 Tax=Vaccinium darrowii TaxID=229202 RepID=A0ACB7Y6L8_9ERIC|nr:hypothetical protein Vadar_013502 [Vaccinium darrowii]